MHTFLLVHIASGYVHSVFVADPVDPPPAPPGWRNHDSGSLDPIDIGFTDAAPWGFKLVAGQLVPATEDERDAAGVHEERNMARIRADGLALYQSLLNIPTGTTFPQAIPRLNTFIAAFRQFLRSLAP